MICQLPVIVGKTFTVVGLGCDIKLKTSVPFVKSKFIVAEPVVNVTVKSVLPPAQIVAVVGGDSVAIGAEFIVTTKFAEVSAQIPFAIITRYVPAVVTK